jgi:hypothetical protein
MKVSLSLPPLHTLLLAVLLWWPLCCMPQTSGPIAPVSTLGTVVETGNTVTVSITATQFNNVASGSHQILFNPGIATATQVSMGPDISGLFNFNISQPGRVRYSWASAYGFTLPDHTVIFNITFSKVSGGSTPLIWDHGYNNRSWGDGSGLLMNDEPQEDFYFPGALTFQEDVTIKVFLEGLYNPGTGLMNKTRDHNGEAFADRFPGSIAERITVRLHPQDDYQNVVFQQEQVALHQDGTAGFSLPAGLSGYFYLSIITRNHLETVSAAPILFGEGLVFYDFTEAAEWAYGNNMQHLGEGVWGLFAGDVNQDGIIDLADRELINDAILHQNLGYLPVDLNGDGVPTAADRQKVHEAYLQTIIAITPE